MDEDATQKPEGNDPVAMLARLVEQLKMGAGNMKGTLSAPEFKRHLETNRHLDGGTPEQAYWHAGIVHAYQSVLKMVQDGVPEWPYKDDGKLDEIARQVSQSCSKQAIPPTAHG